ncbi:hypothetical protein BU15DRAFT_67820 [Melanogaster broomeanus]|nr:hypothetical protein BU15DRAFT_67820 [Melanogaster broomeanus]
MYISVSVNEDRDATLLVLFHHRLKLVCTGALLVVIPLPSWCHRAITADVWFWTFIKGRLFVIKAVDTWPIAVLFEQLRTNPNLSAILGRIPLETCKFYRFEQPVPIDADVAATTRRCSVADWVDITHLTEIKSLAESRFLTDKYVCLVIELPTGETEKAIAELNQQHSELFGCLQITVIEPKKWSKEDVVFNMKGGHFWSHAEPRSDVITGIEDELTEERTYKPSLSGADSLNARKKDPASVNDTREFTSFFNVLRCHAEDAQRVAENRSSHLKSTTFLTYFMLPPFLVACRLTSAIMRGYPKEMDRWRMLSEAIPATRAGYFLMGDGFFIVAIYLRSNLTAERYLVMQTDPDGEVCIAQKDFKLTDSDEAIDFLREMYNLTAKVEALAAGLDPSKLAGERQERQRQARKAGQDNGQSTITSIQEEGGVQEDYFADLEIQRHLEQMGYEIDGVLFGHEHVAKISSPSDRGILKFTRREKEVQILEHLAGIVDPANHTIPGAHVWKMQSGGYIIYMSSGGGHLTSLIQPDAHLWSAAEQLVEAVAFMHRHGVAHLDIKPQNVLIPVHGGRFVHHRFQYRCVRQESPDQVQRYWRH